MCLCTLPSQTFGAEALHLLIPGGAGGGWDRTARGVGEALTRSGLVQQVTFENMSGGGGGKAMAYLIERNRADMLMVNSTPIVVRSLQKVLPQSYRDLTPVASVIGDYSVVAVRSESPLRSLDDIKVALENAPRALAVGGGSVFGGTDHIFAALVYASFGIPAAEVKYIPYDAGGKAMGGLLSGEVQLLSSGYGEVIDLLRQGYVRLLCVAAEERIAPEPDVPTCRESGAERAVFVNWRGFFVSPGTPAERVQAYRQLLHDMQQTREWQSVRQRYGWVNLYRSGAAFERMLAEQELTLSDLLTELGFL